MESGDLALPGVEFRELIRKEIQRQLGAVDQVVLGTVSGFTGPIGMRLLPEHVLTVNQQGFAEVEDVAGFVGLNALDIRFRGTVDAQAGFMAFCDIHDEFAVPLFRWHVNTVGWYTVEWWDSVGGPHFVEGTGIDVVSAVQAGNEFRGRVTFEFDVAGDTRVVFYVWDGTDWVVSSSHTEVGVTATMWTNPADVEIGRRFDGFYWYGHIFEVEFRAGIDGPVFLNPRFDRTQGWRAGEMGSRPSVLGGSGGPAHADQFGNEIVLSDDAEIVEIGDPQVDVLLDGMSASVPVLWASEEEPSVGTRVVCLGLRDGQQWVATSVSPPAVGASRNLVVNPSFEEGMSPHFVFDNGPGAKWDVVVDPAEARSGSRALRLDTSGMAAPETTRFMLHGPEHLWEPHIKVTGTENMFRYGFWVRSDSGRVGNRVRTRSEQWNNSLGIGHLGGAGTSKWVTPGPEWTFVWSTTQSYPLDPRCEWIVFDIEVEQGDAPDQILWIDDIEIVPNITALQRGYRYGGEVVFDTPGVFSFDKADFPGLKAIRVDCQGAGAAGGGAVATGAGNWSAGGGGAGGSHARSLILAGDLDASEAVTVGAGGVPASGAVGGDGGDSAFDTISGEVRGVGGSGGGVGTNVSGTTTFHNGVGGLGEQASSPTSVGDLVSMGDSGVRGFNFASSGVGQGGYGGGSHLGGSVRPTTTQNANGIDGKEYGGGGSGGQNSASQATARAGGAGAKGVVIVELYY